MASNWILARQTSPSVLSTSAPFFILFTLPHSLTWLIVTTLTSVAPKPRVNPSLPRPNFSIVHHQTTISSACLIVTPVIPLPLVVALAFLSMNLSLSYLLLCLISPLLSHLPSLCNFSFKDICLQHLLSSFFIHILHHFPSKLACVWHTQSVCWCLWASTSIPPRLASRRPIWSDMTSVERGLVVGWCGRPHYCYRPYHPTARFWCPSSYVISDEPFLDRSRPMSC